mgnify:CR=1 FL=1
MGTISDDEQHIEWHLELQKDLIKNQSKGVKEAVDSLGENKGLVLERYSSIRASYEGKSFITFEDALILAGMSGYSSHWLLFKDSEKFIR